MQRSTEPEALRINQEAWTRELCLGRSDYYRELVQFSEGHTTDMPKTIDAMKRRYGHGSVKSALKQMFGLKCCYCESMVDAVSYRHVEHFRPQSVYPILAYKWTNLLFACERCNIHKDNAFPVEPHGQLAKPDEQSPCTPDDSDAGMLIDPCRDDPRDHFDYRFYHSASGYIDVELVCKTTRAAMSRDVYDLSRVDLNDARRRHLKVIHALTECYQMLAVANRCAEEMARLQDLLRESIAAASPFSAMSRAYIERYHMAILA